jgi:hypothetical protein
MVVAACVLSALLSARALLTIDPYYDTFAYHLPFAARMIGLCPSSCYRMNEFLETRFLAFPKLFELLHGAVWLLAGTPQVADVLNLAFLAAFAFYLRRAFAVPFAWTLVGLFAVPLIQIHVTASYIDLPLNLAVGVAILAIMNMVRLGGEFGWGPLSLVVACLAFAANSKLTMIPVAAVLGLVMLGLLATRLARGRAAGPFRPGGGRGWLMLIGLSFVAGATIAGTALRNLICFGNPIYPVELHAFGVSLPGLESALIPGDDSLAPAWLSVPSPLRWLASVLEVGGYADRPLPWTYDQGLCLTGPVLEDCLGGTGPSFRMGGYFAGYVLFLIAFLGVQMGRLGMRERRLVLATIGSETILAAVLPHSHELRYYLFWIIVLVALNLICVFSPRFAPASGSVARQVLAFGMLLTLACVVLMTKAHYLAPTGPTIRSLLSELRVDSYMEKVVDGDTICIDPDWQPFSFLFAPVFHPGRVYSALDGALGACTSSIGPPSRRNPSSLSVPEMLGAPRGPTGHGGMP